VALSQGVKSPQRNKEKKQKKHFRGEKPELGTKKKRGGKFPATDQVPYPLRKL